MVAAAFAAAPSVYAQESYVYDIDINLTLSKDGSALVREVWNVDINRGTEWYLVRSKLGDIVISDLKVSDETGREYLNEGSWDVDRSLEQKDGRCGIVEKSDGCEICWGLGSYGSHIYTVEYRMSNVVKAMKDYDKLHLQIVSPGISPRPQHIKATVSSAVDSIGIADANTGIWAFGFDGNASFADSTAVFETASPFESDAYSMIVLCRFDKGMFSPTSLGEQDTPFQESLDTAFEGSDYQEYLDDEKNARWRLISLVVAVIAFITAIKITSDRKRNKNMFGVIKLKEIGYSRELPFDGNLYETRHVLKQVSATSSDANMASALILKMIKDRHLLVSNDADGKVLIGFAPNVNIDKLCDSEKQFYAMLKEAAGEDGVLQEKEFSRWSRRSANQKLITKWISEIPAASAAYLSAHGYGAGTHFSPAGQEQARRVIGFKKFLKDFTLLGERKSEEVALWQDYLIYAALFGIAEKVAKELRDINPQAFEESVGYTYPTMSRVLIFSNNMGTSMVNAVAAQQTRSSVGGHGGHASFGGGGGFSGGGFGGGAR